MIDKAETDLDQRRMMGARLRFVRAEQGKSKEEFAKAMNISPRAYHAYEQGQRSIKSDTLISISEAYNVNLNWLMRGLEVQSLKGYEERVEAFLASLYRHIDQQGEKISAELVGAIVSRWIKELNKGREIPLDDVKIWIDLMKKGK